MIDLKQFTRIPLAVSKDWPFPDDQGHVFPSVIQREGRNEHLVCSFEHSVYRESAGALATLMSAAPELLEALRITADRLAAWRDSHEIWYRQTGNIEHQNARANYDALLSAIEPAISKAEGEVPHA